MKIREILREALRNIWSGTSHSPTLAISLAVAISLGALLDAQVVTGLIREAQVFEQRGGSTLSISVAGGINPAVCEHFAETTNLNPNILAAGALRSASVNLTPVALPESSIPTFEMTAGFRELISGAGSGAQQAGLMVSKMAADQLGLRDGDELIYSQGRRGSTRSKVYRSVVERIFPYPSDGRDGQLEFSILAPAPLTGYWDSCWVKFRYLTAGDEELLRVALRPGLPKDAEVTLRQLNTTLGANSPAAERYLDRATRWVRWALFFFGLLLGALAIRLRRLELAAALHAGVSRSAQLGQLSFETSIWVLAASILALPGVLWSETTSPGSEGVVRAVMLKSLALGCCGVFLGISLALARVREKQLFRYFKDR